MRWTYNRLPNQGKVASRKEACPPAPLFFRGSFGAHSCVCLARINRGGYGREESMANLDRGHVERRSGFWWRVWRCMLQYGTRWFIHQQAIVPPR